MKLKKIIKERIMIPLGIWPIYKCIRNKNTEIKNENDCQAMYWHENHDELEFDKPYSVTSMVCNSSFFDMPFFQYWSGIVNENFSDMMLATNQLSHELVKNKVVYHRKLWEFVYIAQALYERDMLVKGKSGVGFGVGSESLTAIFADMGCRILATDLEISDAQEKGWVNTFQHVGHNLEVLNQYGICDKKIFMENVDYRNVNMNDIPDDIKGYDFTWSACAFEHLGSIENGLEFVKNSLNTLKPGGVAVHTTEFNVYSDDDTLDNNPHFVLFRKKDILRLARELEKDGHYVWPIDFNVGDRIVDNFVDLPPYSQNGMHLKLQLAQYASTSIGIIIKKKIS